MGIASPTRPVMGIAVDASMRGGKTGASNGVIEWRVVDLVTGHEIHRSNIYPQGTISLAELLAIYDGLKFFMDANLHNEEFPFLYTDSKVAYEWANGRPIKSSLPVNEATGPLWSMVWSDQGWAELPEVRDVIKDKLRMWNTKEWGENPADLGYKKYKKNFYAVKVGRKTGIYDNWKDCSEQVIGFPKAKFRGFESLDQAKAWI